jgi:hypothetical protein
MTLGLSATQTLTEMITEDISVGKALPARIADNLTAI